jgi:hypothetical protein
MLTPKPTPTLTAVALAAAKASPEVTRQVVQIVTPGPTTPPTHPASVGEKVLDLVKREWMWGVGFILTIALIYWFTRSREEKLPPWLLAKLANVQIGDNSGARRLLSEDDRRKIARGMVQMMQAQSIPPERVKSDDDVFIRVMGQALAQLVSSGQLTLG